MMTKTIQNIATLLSILLALLFIFTAYTFTFAQTQQTSYPIAELGNCGSKAECEAYCDDVNNTQACTDYQQQNGTMTNEEAADIQTLGTAIANGDGPGGCSSFSECQNYCDDINNVQECTQFAASLNLVSQTATRVVTNTQNISNYLSGGGSLPGNCSSYFDCAQYCSSFNNFSECADFGVQSGTNLAASITSGSQSSNSLTSSMKTVSDMFDSGNTPGGCDSRSDCLDYCDDTGHAGECVQFVVSLNQTILGGSSGFGGGSGSGSGGTGSGSGSNFGGGGGSFFPGSGNGSSGGSTGGSGSGSGSTGSGSGSGSGSSGFGFGIGGSSSGSGSSGSGSTGSGSGSGSTGGGSSSPIDTAKSIIDFQKCIDEKVEEEIEEAIEDGDDPSDAISPSEADEMIRECATEELEGQYPGNQGISL